MKNSVLRFFIISVVIVVTQACSTVPQTSIESFKGELPKNSGIVIAETLTNSQRITGPIQVWDELIIWQVKTPSEKGGGSKKGPSTLSIKALTRSSESQQYMGVIPAGKYRIGLLWAYIYGGTEYWAKAFVPPMLGTFEVKAGEVTDLGKLIYHPFQARSAASLLLPDYVITRVASPELWPRIQEEHKSLVENLGIKDINSWNDDAFDEVRQNAYQLIVDSASAKNIHKFGEHFLLSGRLGMLKSINHWRRQVSTETIHDVVELNNDTWVAGGEFGLLTLVSPSDGSVLESLDVLDAKEHVYSLEKIDDSRFLVVTLHNKVFLLYIYSLKEKSLERIARHERKQSVFSNHLPSVHALADSSSVRIYIDGKQHTYDLANKTWTQVNFKNLLSLYRQKNGIIMATPTDPFVARGVVYYSNDGGEYWSKYKRFSIQDIYRLASGISVRTGVATTLDFWSGRRVDAEAVPVLVSNDDGLSWVAVGSLPIGCNEIAIEASVDSMLISLCEDGRVMGSSDVGKHWDEIHGPITKPFDEFPGPLKLKYATEQDDAGSGGETEN